LPGPDQADLATGTGARAMLVCVDDPTSVDIDSIDATVLRRVRGILGFAKTQFSVLARGFFSRLTERYLASFLGESKEP
jgi:hypothetical protein